MTRLALSTKLKYYLPAFFVGIATVVCFLEWQHLPETALVGGDVRVIDRTVGIVLRSRADPRLYERFSRDEIRRVLDGAGLTLSGGLASDAVSVTGDSGQIKWRKERNVTYRVPALLVRIRATIRVPAGSAGGPDTLRLELPALPGLATASGTEALLAATQSSEPQGASSNVVDVFTRYPNHTAVDRARLPYLIGMIALGLVFVAITTRILYLMRGHSPKPA